MNMNTSIQNQDSNNKYIPLQNESLSNSNNIIAQPIPQYPYPQPQMLNVLIPSSQVVQNQIYQPKVIYVDSTYFKTSPCKTICPFCKNMIITKVNKKFNWWSCALCYCCGLFTWMTLQCCRNKKLNCYDADHFCPSCGIKIVEYSSC